MNERKRTKARGGKEGGRGMEERRKKKMLDSASVTGAQGNVRVVRMHHSIREQFFFFFLGTGQ